MQYGTLFALVASGGCQPKAPIGCTLVRAIVPLHVWHLADWRPEVVSFLGLGPGWRFLTEGAYEDAWNDPKRLNA